MKIDKWNIHHYKEHVLLGLVMTRKNVLAFVNHLLRALDEGGEDTKITIILEKE